MTKKDPSPLRRRVLQVLNRRSAELDLGRLAQSFNRMAAGIAERERRITQLAFVRAITDFARALGMETTAEGVENRLQLAELRLQGCSSVQGYLFSRPINAAAVLESLVTANPVRDVA